MFCPSGYSLFLISRLSMVQIYLNMALWVSFNCNLLLSETWSIKIGLIIFKESLLKSSLPTSTELNSLKVAIDSSPKVVGTGRNEIRRHCLNFEDAPTTHSHCSSTLFTILCSSFEVLLHKVVPSQGGLLFKCFLRTMSREGHHHSTVVELLWA